MILRSPFANPCRVAWLFNNRSISKAVAVPFAKAIQNPLLGGLN